MAWLDNMIAAISPAAACRREAARRMLEEMRSYDAASGDRINAGWRVVNQSAELTDRPGRDVVRARARDLERNSDIAQSVLHAYRRNVVGRGYALRALTGDEALDTRLEKAWKRWTDARNCDVTGEQSFHEILRMMVDRKRVDGGILILFRYTRGGLVPFKLQCLEVDELDVSQSSPKHRGNKVVGGVEYNRYRQPVGYWFRQYDLEGYQAMAPVFVDAKDVFFFKSKRRPSQLREMSDLAPTVTRIRDVNEFITAVSVKERLSAILAIFIKKLFPSGGNIGRNATTGGAGKTDYACWTWRRIWAWTSAGAGPIPSGWRPWHPLTRRRFWRPGKRAISRRTRRRRARKDVQQAGVRPEASAVVRTVFCVYHEDEEQGALSLLNLMEALRVALLERPVLPGPFALNLKAGLEALAYPDDGEPRTAPYYLGEMISTWNMPPVVRLDAARVIHGAPPWDPGAEHLTETTMLKGSE